jgi:hypothetical protein
LLLRLHARSGERGPSEHRRDDERQQPRHAVMQQPVMCSMMMCLEMPHRM